MNNNLLLTYLANILPKLTLAFVGILLLYKFYFRVRAKYSKKVNCWFCNTNTKVPYAQANSFVCPNCEQYNGFNKAGDYNREIKEHYLGNGSSSKHALNTTNPWLVESTAYNGFCDACNEAQRLKIEKLSQFEPKKESRYDAELKKYKNELEQQYRLCTSCERHLKSVLRNKKKMVLGTKFLEFIMKTAENFKQPHMDKIRHAKQILWKRRIALLITLLTFINLCCLVYVLPELNRAWLEHNLGESFGAQIFMLCSHFVACWRVLIACLVKLMENETVLRLGLFARTVFMMLLYSLGLRLPQLVRLNFLSIYLLSAPFCILGLILMYNCIDRFKLTRYTILLALWSLCGLLELSTSTVHQCLLFAACLVTTALNVTSKVENSPKLYDRTASSFHKIYADDYLSDCDSGGSGSLLDYQLDCSSLSARSELSNSFASLKRASLRTSPLSSSTFSLNAASHTRSNLQPLSAKSPFSASTFSLNQTNSGIRGTQQQQFGGNHSNSFYNTTGGMNSSIRSRASNSVFNSTFAAPNPFNLSTSQQYAPSATSFSTAHNNSFNNSRQSIFADHTTMRTPAGFNHGLHSPMSNTPSLRSAFSASTTALHNFERPSRVLTPSRFSVQPQLQSPTIAYANSVSNVNPQLGGFFEQSKAPFSRAAAARQHNKNLSTINENLSRASSRSSGFESQNGLLNNSRENSFSQADTTPPATAAAAPIVDFHNKTFTLDSSRSFQPIDNDFPLNKAPNEIDNSFSLLSLHQPLTVNCGNSSAWQPTAPYRMNLFNPPNLRRGDLLRKWKEGSIAMT